jgi:hypothetical protein
MRGHCAWLLLLLAGSVACETSCHETPEDKRFVRFQGGDLDASGTFFETAPIDGPYTEFWPNSVLEIPHRLQAAPAEVDAYVAFEEDPINFTNSAGDLAVFDCVDDEMLRVRNATCQKLFVRVTAEVKDFGERAVEPCE